MGGGLNCNVHFYRANVIAMQQIDADGTELDNNI